MKTKEELENLGIKIENKGKQLRDIKERIKIIERHTITYTINENNCLLLSNQ